MTKSIHLNPPIPIPGQRLLVDEDGHYIEYSSANPPLYIFVIYLIFKGSYFFWCSNNLGNGWNVKLPEAILFDSEQAALNFIERHGLDGQVCSLDEAHVIYLMQS